MIEELTIYHDLFDASLPVDYTKEAERWVNFAVEYLKKKDPIKLLLIKVWLRGLDSNQRPSG
jgi:hypothetical protein